MNLNLRNLKYASAVAALSVVLTACGGSEPAASDSTTTAEAPAPEVAVEEAVVEAEAAAEEVAAEATDAAEDATEAVEEAVDEGMEDAADAAAEVEEAATEAVEDATEAAAEVVEAAAPAADARVSAETIAAYESLTGNASNGRRVFTQCMSCHAVQEGRNMAGPSLYGIIGRTAGSVEGFRYSDANADSGIVWTEPTMFAYLEKPQQFIPGTFMAFPGLPREQDRADVIAYLQEQSQ